MVKLYWALRKRRSEFLERYIIPNRLKKQAEKVDQHIQKLHDKVRGDNAPIKVGFVVQAPEMWNKEAPVYEKMAEDGRFDPWLIVVPGYNNLKMKRERYGTELDFFKKQYPDAKIFTSKELSFGFRKLKKQKFDYIVYQRCWENVLPETIRANRVIKYAKTCYIPYAFHCFKAYPEYYSTSFFLNLYLMFCCSRSQQNAYQPEGLRKTVFLGFPCLESLRAAADHHSQLRLLWTPRWTENPRYGGTTFFAYKDRFFELAEKYPELTIVMRPHPLTFENAIKTGQMTPAEVNAYKAHCADAGIVFDKNASIDDTLSEIDILLSDFSSILVDAALMGKTIIYCGGNAFAEPDETFEKILKCVYQADSWDDITSILSQQLQGEDPLRQSRMKLAEQLSAEHKNSTARILQFIADDAKYNENNHS